MSCQLRGKPLSYSKKLRLTLFMSWYLFIAVKLSLIILIEFLYEVFAVRQADQSLIDDILVDVSSPSSPNYQKWLTFEEVGDLTSNRAATETILQWLKFTFSNSDNSLEAKETANIVWQSAHGEYIKATASIGHWEKLLQTEFFEYKDTQPFKKVPIKILNFLSTGKIIYSIG
jgi:hypothetical protein